MNVLVVDDEPLVRRSLRRALEKLGHSVAEAEDGEQGLSQWEATRPQLVFLDVLMPRLSGPELLKRLSGAAKAEAKVVLMSAFSGEYDLEKAKLLGAHLFIPKPFEDVFAVARQGEDLTRA